MSEQKKAPTGLAPVKGSSNKLYSQHQCNQNHSGPLILVARFTCRHTRLLKRLLAGPLPRMEADRVTGTTNAPEYISQLRHEFHLQIKTERVEVIDRDGFKTRPGIYHLEPESRAVAIALLEVCEARGAA